MPNFLRRKPKRIKTGYTVKETPYTVKKGTGTSTVSSFGRGKVTKTFVPSTMEDTGSKPHGKEGGGTDPSMRKQIREAVSEGRDVSRPGTTPGTRAYGNTYRTGHTLRETGPADIKVKQKVDPTITAVKKVITPIYKTKYYGKNKARTLTLGGSGRRGEAATKSATGTRKLGIILKGKRKRP
jgi:hypothetical protein